MCVATFRDRIVFYSDGLLAIVQRLGSRNGSTENLCSQIMRLQIREERTRSIFEDDENLSERFRVLFNQLLVVLRYRVKVLEDRGLEDN
jgi:hypothetical protein